MSTLRPSSRCGLAERAVIVHADRRASAPPIRSRPAGTRCAGPDRSRAASRGRECGRSGSGAATRPPAARDLDGHLGSGSALDPHDAGDVVDGDVVARERAALGRLRRRDRHGTTANGASGADPWRSGRGDGSRGDCLERSEESQCIACREMGRSSDSGRRVSVCRPSRLRQPTRSLDRVWTRPRQVHRIDVAVATARSGPIKLPTSQLFLPPIHAMPMSETHPTRPRQHQSRPAPRGDPDPAGGACPRNGPARSSTPPSTSSANAASPALASTTSRAAPASPKARSISTSRTRKSSFAKSFARSSSTASVRQPPKAGAGDPVEELKRYLRAHWDFVRSPEFQTIFKLVTGELHNFPDLAEFYGREVVMPANAAARRHDPARHRPRRLPSCRSDPRRSIPVVNGHDALHVVRSTARVQAAHRRHRRAGVRADSPTSSFTPSARLPRRQPSRAVSTMTVNDSATTALGHDVARALSLSAISVADRVGAHRRANASTRHHSRSATPLGSPRNRMAASLPRASAPTRRTHASRSAARTCCLTSRRSALENGRTLNTATFGIDFPTPPGQPPVFDPEGQLEGPVNILDTRAHFSQSLFDAGALGRVRSARAAAAASDFDADASRRSGGGERGGRVRARGTRRRTAWARASPTRRSPRISSASRASSSRRASALVSTSLARSRSSPPFARSSSRRAMTAAALVSSCCARSACRSTRA